MSKAGKAYGKDLVFLENNYHRDICDQSDT